MARKLTKKEWKALEKKEAEEEERSEKHSERLAFTKPVKERLEHTRKLFKKRKSATYFG